MLPEQPFAERAGKDISPDYYGVMRLRRFISGLFIAISSVLAVALPAGAHTEVVSTSPTDGINFGVTPPAKIEVTFNEPPLYEGSAIVLNDESGNEVQLGTLELTGNTLSAAVPPDLPSGKSTVTWRAAADDGHVVTGTFSFYFAADGVIPQASSTPDATMTAYATDSAAQTTGGEDSGLSSDDNAWIILLAAFVASSTVASIYVKKKRKSVD